MKGWEMQRYRIYQHGGLDALRYEDAPTPVPGPEELLVRHHAIGVNYTDVQARIGGSVYATIKDLLPMVPGVEGAGEVLAVGERVSDFRVGESIAYAGVFGAYAEEVLIPEDRAIKLPPGIDAKMGAAVLTQGTTAHIVAHAVYPLKQGQTVLVQAGAGGVSLLLIQMLKRLGVRVLTTVSSEEKAALAKGAGADHVIIYTREDFEAEVKKATNNEGVHAVFDGVGKTTFEKSLNCLRPRGYMIMFGESSGPPPSFLPATLGTKGSLFLTRVLGNDYYQTREERAHCAADLFRWILSGELKVHIHKTYPFDRAAEAQQELESRKSAGKMLLLP